MAHLYILIDSYILFCFVHLYDLVTDSVSLMPQTKQCLLHCLILLNLILWNYWKKPAAMSRIHQAC